MQGFSAEFGSLVVTSYTNAARIDVRREGVIVMTLLVTAGTVTADRNNKYMRRFDCTIAGIDPRTGEELTPQGIRDILAPFGAELLIYKGIRVPYEFEVVSLNEEAEDWNDGYMWGMAVNEDGALVMAA